MGADAINALAIIHYSSFIIHWGRSQTVPFFLPSPQAPQGEANVVRCKIQRRTCVMRNVTFSTSPSNRTTSNFSGALPGCVAVTVSTAPSTPGNRNMRIRSCPKAPLISAKRHGFHQCSEPGANITVSVQPKFASKNAPLKITL